MYDSQSQKTKKSHLSSKTGKTSKSKKSFNTAQSIKKLKNALKDSIRKKGKMNRDEMILFTYLNGLQKERAQQLSNHI